MASTTFVAFASKDPLLSEMIADACGELSTQEHNFVPWSRNDPSGHPINKSVNQWIDEADSIVADISDINHNVTFEIGLAIGLSKPLRLTRLTTKSWKEIEETGLLHNLAHDGYRDGASFRKILREPYPAVWSPEKKNRAQPVYLLRPAGMEPLLRRAQSGVKKIMRLGFRSTNPKEINRLTATEAFEQVTSSFGVLLFWATDAEPDALTHNQRTMFSLGLAVGLDIPFRIVAHVDSRLPLDVDEIATRYTEISDVDNLLRDFRDDVAEYEQDFVDIKETVVRPLESISCGNPAAEDEATTLDDYFVETEQFRLTRSGSINVILGRKGTGKTAIFLRARDIVRKDRKNLVIDLQPEGFQLIKLKEIAEELGHGSQKEFIAAFWEYIIWLEIAYKILEKDQHRIKYDSALADRFISLREAYNSRVDTGSGDFSERLLRLSERISERFASAETGDESVIKSSKILQVVYGAEIRSIRDQVLSYLKLKGIVFFLFDNIDRFRRLHGFDQTDALFITGLIEALQDIKRRFSRGQFDFQWAVFIRSDVYEFVVQAMNDFGKLATASTEWADRSLLKELFQNRVLNGLPRTKPLVWTDVWNSISVQNIDGRPTLDYLLDASMIRPRYLIRLFETARRRAITFRRERIEEEDYAVGLEELGYQVIDDFERELADVVPGTEAAVIGLGRLRGALVPSQIYSVLRAVSADESEVERCFDVLIWMGVVGVRQQNRVLYISDCGFRRQILKSMIDTNSACLSLHPTFTYVMNRLVADSKL